MSTPAAGSDDPKVHLSGTKVVIYLTLTIDIKEF